MKLSGPNASESASDSELLHGISESQDEAAYAVLVRRYERVAYNLALRIVCDSARAEDAVQEGLFKVWQHAGEFQALNESSCKSWLLKIVANTALTMHRSEMRHSNRMSRKWTQMPPAPTEGSSGGDDEVRRALGQALSGLENQDQRILALSFAGGLTLREIGEALEMPQSTVNFRIKKALEKLRVDLAGAGLGGSLAAMPVLLAEHLPQALLDGGPAPSSLCEKLLDQVGRSTQKVVEHSRRMAGVPGIPYGLVAAAVACLLAAAAVVLIRPWESAVGSLPQAGAHADQKAFAPEVPSVANDSGSRVFEWNFDEGMGAELVPRSAFSGDELRKDWPIPAWEPGRGRIRSGSVKFREDGSSLLVKVPLPARDLPLWINFLTASPDGKAPNVGVQVVFGDRRKPANMKVMRKESQNLKLTAKSLREWSQWNCILAISPERGLPQFTMNFNGNKVGGWVEVAADEFWASPEGEIYFEVFGENFLLDNLSIGYGALPPQP